MKLRNLRLLIVRLSLRCEGFHSMAFQNPELRITRFLVSQSHLNFMKLGDLKIHY